MYLDFEVVTFLSIYGRK